MTAARREAAADAGGPGRGRQAGRPSPLATVVAALERAHRRGELGEADLAWSRARLSGRSRASPSLPRTAERAEEIVRAATSVFLARGYHHATIADVADALGLSKAGVYHYFGAKQDLLETVCDRAMRAIEEAVAAGMASGETPGARLAGVLERYAGTYLENERVTVLMRHFDDVSPVFLATLRSRRKRVEGRFRRLLAEGVDAGVFDVADPAVVAFGLIGSLNWVHTWFDPSGRLSTAEVRTMLVRQAMSSVDVDPAGERPRDAGGNDQ